jgi:hypothetical protein
MLTPAQWEEARAELYRQQTLLAENLGSDLARQSKTLTDFFRDVDGGDLIAGRQPVSIATLDAALSLYRSAEEKAGQLSDTADLRFITQLKISESLSRREALVAEVRQRQAALQARTGSAVAVSQKPLFEPLGPAESVERAIVEFGDGNFEIALHYFRNVYDEQITSMFGKSKLQGFLGLPPEHRPYIVFLTELDLLKGTAGYDDTRAVGQALERLYDRIDAQKGLWKGISERRRGSFLELIERVNSER